MDKQEIITALQLLHEEIEKCSSLKRKYDKAADRLNNAKSRESVAVQKFDKEKKEPYIVSRIGREPSKPLGVLKITGPLYQSMMVAYEKQLIFYVFMFSIDVLHINPIGAIFAKYGTSLFEFGEQIRDTFWGDILKSIIIVLVKQVLNIVIKKKSEE